MRDLAFVFGIGLLSSMHCVGMCGGFVLAIGKGRTMYFAGKTLTYTVFGALAGVFGSAVMTARFQNALSIALGVILVLIGASLVGLLRRIRLGEGLARSRPIARALAYFLKRPSPFGLGVVNGLLPCALVYGMLVKAASTGTAWEGALTMAVFGSATIPALFLLGLSGTLIRPSWRLRLSRVGGVLVILLGLLTIARGTPLAEAVLPSHGSHSHVAH